MVNWIGIKNQLPTNGKFILMKWNGKVQQCIYYRDSDDNGDFYQDSMDDYDGMPESDAFKGDMHWMYLPE